MARRVRSASVQPVPTLPTQWRPSGPGCDIWICRRDGSIRLPYGEIVHHTRDGIPYLAPELVLLFKAKHVRPKDQADFDATLPHLSPEQRASLARLLDRVHPGHPWLAGL